MDALTLKQKLQHIQSSNHSIDHEEQPYELALHMMKHIGSTDPVLRDELIYVTFATWIGQGVFSEDQLKAYVAVGAGRSAPVLWDRRAGDG